MWSQRNWWGDSYGHGHQDNWSTWSWSSQDWKTWKSPAPTFQELAQNDDASGLRRRLSEDHDAVNVLSHRGWSLLQLAAISGSVGCTEVLLQHGADVSARSGYLSPSALHLASWHGHVAVAKALLSNSADPCSLNGLGEFAIEKAHQRGKTDVEKLLLEFGSPCPAPARRVKNNNALTALACAAARAAESDRPDNMFFDPLAHRLACEEGREVGGGMSWVLTPRTYVGDEFLRECYYHGARQAVLIGAGMDARAYRMGLRDLHVFEVDQATIFDVKEPLLQGVPLRCKGRHTVSLDFCSQGSSLSEALRSNGFDTSIPSVWLLEGLVMYLADRDVDELLAQINQLTPAGSAVFHDAVSATSQKRGIQCCGANFASGNDDYAGLWNGHAFDKVDVINFEAVVVDRWNRTVRIDRSRSAASPSWVAGRQATFFVKAHKTC